LNGRESLRREGCFVRPNSIVGDNHFEDSSGNLDGFWDFERIATMLDPRFRKLGDDTFWSFFFQQ
jgi:hypothetical protein